MARKTGRLFGISKFSFDKYGIYWVAPGESSCLEGLDSQYAWLRGVGSLCKAMLRLAEGDPESAVFRCMKYH